MNKKSYAWKSILQACHVIDVGSIWRISARKSVQIREDRWIPKIPAGKIVSPFAVPSPAASFSALLDEETCSCKADLVRQEFLPHKVNLILGIPLSDQVISNKFVWLPSSNGNYTTYSAYYLLSIVNRSLQPNCST